MYGQQETRPMHKRCDCVELPMACPMKQENSQGDVVTVLTMCILCFSIRLACGVIETVTNYSPNSATIIVVLERLGGGGVLFYELFGEATNKSLRCKIRATMISLLCG